MSAVPLVSAAVYEQFVPQMLNYESVGGVNFKKGCYPGQEVVAAASFAARSNAALTWPRRLERWPQGRGICYQ